MEDKEGAKTRRKKLKIIFAVVAVILIGGGIVLALALNGVFSPEPEPEPEPELAEEVAEIEVNAPEVQYLYAFFDFKKQCSELGQVRNFYVDKGVREGKPSLAMMIDLALSSEKVALGKCRYKATVTAEAEKLKERYSKYWDKDDLTFWDLNQANEKGCYSGENTRKVIQEIFGKEVTLVDEVSVLGDWLHYAAGEDELFHGVLGAGCFAPTYIRTLIKAERSDKHIYLYEAVGNLKDGKLTRLFGEEKPERNYGLGTPEVYVGAHPEEFEQFKWTFEKTEAGNYVFAGLEEVI